MNPPPAYCSSFSYPTLAPTMQQSCSSSCTAEPPTLRWTTATPLSVLPLLAVPSSPSDPLSHVVSLSLSPSFFISSLQLTAMASYGVHGLDCYILSNHPISFSSLHIPSPSPIPSLFNSISLYLSLLLSLSGSSPPPQYNCHPPGLSSLWPPLLTARPLSLPYSHSLHLHLHLLCTVPPPMADCPPASCQTISPCLIFLISLISLHLLSLHLSPLKPKSSNDGTSSIPHTLKMQ